MTTPISEEGKRRIKFATRFLDEELLPALEQGKKLLQQDIESMLETFQTHNIGLGIDFTLDHVWGVAWKRTLYYESQVKSNPEQELPANARLVYKAWKLLTDIELTEEEGS